MSINKAEASWEGGLREGSGTMKTGSGAYNGAYSFDTRFGEEKGTNPEELIAAAHAGCFTMALAGALQRVGFPVTRIDTTAKVHLEKTDAGFRIVRIDLDTRAVVPGVDDAGFQKTAQATKTACPISAALAAVPEINLTATLLA